LFAATSGSSVGAWLGGLQLHGQVTALEGLGVRPARYLWAPSWVGLVVAYLATFGVFTIAMLLGGWCLYASSQVSDALGIIAADFIAPPPSRYPALARALWSVGIYTLAIASIVVAKGREAKQSSDDVTGAMTSSVMRVTLFVVVMELLSMLVMRAWGGLHG
jgi:ABC-type transporter Mla maintaining outer membrane lipid asymmetry permease subunit MlaE